MEKCFEKLKTFFEKSKNFFINQPLFISFLPAWNSIKVVYITITLTICYEIPKSKSREKQKPEANE